ncbi:MAG: hypothetical protein R3F49_11830 [Planctomycetota bacterium]
MQRALLFAAIVSLTACGGTTEPSATDAASPGAARAVTKASVAPGRAAREVAVKTTVPVFEPLTLVPSDTVAVVRIASMAALEDAILKVSAIAERAGNPVPIRNSLMLAFAQAGVEWNKVREREPIVVAVRLPAGKSEPEFIAYLPVALAGPSNDVAQQTEVEGDYLALTQPGKSVPAAAPPDWCDGVPAGLMRARVDAKALLKRFGPLVPMALQSFMPAGDTPPELAAEVARQQAELLAMIQSVRQLDLTVDLDGGQLELAAALDVEGGPIAASASQRGNALASLARHLSLDAPLAGALSFDVDNAEQSGAEQLSAMLGVVPEPMRATLSALHDASLSFLGAFEPGAITLVDPTPGSMYVAWIMSSKDPARSRDALGELLGAVDFDALGFDLSLPVRSRIGGAVVENFALRFDTRRLDFDARAQMRTAFESFLGDESVHIMIATSGQEVMFVLGGDTPATQARIRAFSNPSGIPDELKAGLAAIGDSNPASVWRVDAARLLTLGAEFNAAATGGSAAAARRDALRTQPNLGSVPLVLWGGTRTDSAFGGLSVDLDDLESAMRLLGPR